MPLAMCVDYFWFVQGYNPAHSKELALPDGSVEVVIDLRDDPIRLFDRENRELIFGTSILCGPHSDYFVIDTACESKVVGIHFKPGGIHSFLKEPLDEILNVHLSLHTLWGSRVNEIRDELLTARVADEMFRVLERRLLSLAVKDLERNPAVQYVLSNLHRSQVAEIMEQIGMSHRRLNQMFKEEVGMPPKRLSRLYRFQEVLHCINDGKRISWTDIALACGYYDQAHFIKDFQSFSGINPSDYRPISGRHHNHAAFSK
jgi:AraC-like DNA-binding protein